MLCLPLPYLLRHRRGEDLVRQPASTNDPRSGHHDEARSFLSLRQIQFLFPRILESTFSRGEIGLSGETSFVRLARTQIGRTHTVIRIAGVDGTDGGGGRAHSGTGGDHRRRRRHRCACLTRRLTRCLTRRAEHGLQHDEERRRGEEGEAAKGVESAIKVVVDSTAAMDREWLSLSAAWLFAFCVRRSALLRSAPLCWPRGCSGLRGWRTCTWDSNNEDSDHSNVQRTTDRSRSSSSRSSKQEKN